MFETQKVRRHDKFRKEWSSIRAYARPQKGQDQVSGGVSVPYWLAAPVGIFYGNLQNLVIRSKSVLKSGSVIISQIGVMSDQLRVSLYMVMSQNVMWHLGEGDFIIFYEIPIWTNFLGDDFKRSMTYACSRSLDESSAALRIKHS